MVINTQSTRVGLQSLQGAMMASQPTFKGFLKASGHAEVWDDTDVNKFEQFGWRSTTNESSYSSGTLVGNWNEERFDVKELSNARPLPSQYDHYFETTYRAEFSQGPQKVPEALRTNKDKDLRAFPGHQPVLDSDELKRHYHSFLTTTREAYSTPNDDKTPNNTTQQ